MKLTFKAEIEIEDDGNEIQIKTLAENINPSAVQLFASQVMGELLKHFIESQEKNGRSVKMEKQFLDLCETISMQYSKLFLGIDKPGIKVDIKETSHSGYGS